MTAEIAVMNEEAIALAADSAVSGPKIFTSANKIFALSKYHPVGVMVFASAQFLNVPWETIIKQYRAELGKKSFASLAEHAEHFVNYFNGENRLFPSDAQERSVSTVVEALCQWVLKETQRQLSLRETDEEPDDDEIVEEAERAIAELLKQSKDSERRSDLPKNYRATIREKYKDQIEETIDLAVADSGLSDKAKQQLAEAVPWYLESVELVWPSPSGSGIVIAGFGDKDVFPRLRRFQFQAIAAGRLKFREGEPVNIGHNNPSVISAFAQDREVHTFMRGVDPRINGYLEEWWPQKLYEVVGEVGENLGLDDAQHQKLLEQMTERCWEIFGEYQQNLQEFQLEQNITPILSIVAMLPKDELAAMAESLVNPTSFKRRVTDEEETVGGPIDVAVISRGDGFIWIKRKHYFKPELNPQFLANYYREEDAK